MSCVTCGHTMASISSATLRCWHCERCGTLKIERGGTEDIYVPKLVERCRQFVQEVYTRHNSYIPTAWHTLGIAESINLPGERP